MMLHRCAPTRHWQELRDFTAQKDMRRQKEEWKFLGTVQGMGNANSGTSVIFLAKKRLNALSLSNCGISALWSWYRSECSRLQVASEKS